MLDEIVTPDLAVRIEAAEIHAWLDLYDAMPEGFAREFGPEIRRVGDVVLTLCPTLPFVHFNCVFNLGLDEPATEAQIDEVLGVYQKAGMESFAVYHTPHSRPSKFTEWLAARGLLAHGGWDRIYRAEAPPPALDTDLEEGEFRVEKVAAETAPGWAGYIDDRYGLPTKPWLLALSGRPGWHHYLLRRDMEIQAVRSMYLHSDGWAWFGIEAPVPGLMAPSYDLDFRLCQVMVRDGIALGGRAFVADIEAPDAGMDTPAYRHFGSLGFRRTYFRSHYRYG